MSILQKSTSILLSSTKGRERKDRPNAVAPSLACRTACSTRRGTKAVLSTFRFISGRGELGFHLTITHGTCMITEQQTESDRRGRENRSGHTRHEQGEEKSQDGAADRHQDRLYKQTHLAVRARDRCGLVKSPVEASPGHIAPNEPNLRRGRFLGGPQPDPRSLDPALLGFRAKQSQSGPRPNKGQVLCR